MSEITWGHPAAANCRRIMELAYDTHHRSSGRANYLFHWRNGQYCMAAAESDWAKLGQAAAATAGDTKLAGQWTEYDHFGMLVLLGLRAWAGGKFPARAQRALETMVRQECSARGGAFRNDFEFENDNYPFMACAIEILGGQMLRRDDIAGHGLIKLAQYSQQMATNGITSEFCSPNYAPWHVVPLSMIAAMARNSEARRRAKTWCDFIWFELSQRWHNGLCQMTGPNSRAYAEEIYGGWSYMHAMMHRLIGSPLGLDPALARVTGHDEDFHTCSYFCFCPIYFPAWARRICLRRPAGETVRASGQVGHSWDGSISLFASKVHTCTRSTPNYSLASATRPWNGGWQSNVAIAYWNLQSPPTSLKHQRVAYARMLLDDHGPLRDNVYVTNFEPGKPVGGPLVFQDDGLCCAHQEDNVLLLVSRPKWSTRRRKAIRQTLLISDYAWCVPEVFVNGRPAKPPYRSTKPGIVVIKDGPVVMGLRALEVTDWGRRCCLEIVRQEKHLWISFWNYQGRPRVFSVDELQATRNGFAWIVEDADSVTPAELHRRLAGAKVTDQVKGVYRTVTYRDSHSQLMMKTHRDCPDPHALEIDAKALEFRMFDGPYVQGGFDRDLVVGQARLTANRHPLFLRGDPGGNEYAVYNLAGQPCDWRLKIGAQTLVGKDMAFGMTRIVRRQGKWCSQTSDGNTGNA